MVLYTDDLQVCFTNQEFVVQMLCKNAIYLKKLRHFFKGNSIFYYKFGLQIPDS